MDLFDSLLDYTSQDGAKLIRPIVPIEEWVESEYYASPDIHSLYPFWKQHMIKIFNSPVNINEVILHGCLSLDTLYPTDKGMLSLKEIENLVGNIYVWNDYGKKVLVKGVHYTPKIKGKKITLSNGQVLKATPNHEFKNIRGDWVKVQDLEVGDMLLQSMHPTMFSQSYSNDLDLAYLLGYIIGDGYTTRNNRDDEDSVIGLLYRKDQNNSKFLFETFKKYIGECEEKTKSCKGLVMIRKTNREFIKRYPEILGHAYHKRIPEYIKKSDSSHQSAFLRGLFDSDGTVDNRRVTIALSNKILIEEIRVMLQSLGIYSSYDIKKTKRKDSHRLTIMRKFDLRRYKDIIGFDLDYKQQKLEKLIFHKRENSICYGAGDLLREHYKNCHLTLTRKQGKELSTSWRYQKEVTFEILDRYYNFNSEWFNLSSSLKYLREVKGQGITIVNIEDIEDVFGDIEIDDPHAYNLSGIISHNSLGRRKVNICLFSCFKENI